MRVICFFILLIGSTAVTGQSLTENALLIDGYNRKYLVYEPSGINPNTHYPMVIVLHGGGGNAKQVMNFCGFNALAQKEKFFAVYPNGYKKGWHDGRIAPSVNAYEDNVDDIKFIKSLIAEILSHYPIDPQRIFATGISNGAMMSLHLAGKLSETIRAIAPVCGSIAENQQKEYKPAHPVAVLIINGTADPLVPYLGGPVLSERANRGRVVSTPKMMEIWMSFVPNPGKETVLPMADKDPNDGCHAERLMYPPWGPNNPIQLIRINEGGHTWPGAKQYLPKMIVGKVCRDFKAEEIIWDFFKNLPPR